MRARRAELQALVDQQKAELQRKIESQKENSQQLSVSQETIMSLQKQLDEERAGKSKFCSEIEILTKKLEEYDKFFCGVPTKSEEIYDWILKGNSITELKTTGWKISHPGQIPAQKTLQVCVIGHFNKGKSFLLGYLSDKKIPAGFQMHTEGVSIIFAKHTNNGNEECTVYLDTKGFEMPIPLPNEPEKVEKTIQECKITEEIYQQFILDSSHMILCVVGHLTFPDQILVRKMIQDHMRKKDKDYTKTLFIIHNLSMMRSIKDVERIWKEEVLTAFDIEPLNFSGSMAGQNPTYYVERRERRIRHLIMAQERTEAGDYFNPPMKKYLRACFETETERQTFDPTKSIHEFLKRNLSQYLETVQVEIDLIPDPITTTTTLKLKTDAPPKAIKFDSFQRIISESKVEVGWEIIQTKSHLYMVFDFPGMSEADIEDSIEGFLTEPGNEIAVVLRGEKKRSIPQPDGRFLEIEEITSELKGKGRTFGKFEMKLPIITKDIQLQELKPKRIQKDGQLVFQWSISSGQAKVKF